MFENVGMFMNSQLEIVMLLTILEFFDLQKLFCEWQRKPINCTEMFSVILLVNIQEQFSRVTVAYMIKSDELNKRLYLHTFVFQLVPSNQGMCCVYNLIGKQQHHHGGSSR